MPQIAFGLYNVPRADTRRSVRLALDCGYRHFDSASFYNNEAELGAELSAWVREEGNRRCDLFVTTKVWTTDLKDPEAAVRSANISIDELGLGYVDCLMVHWPVPGKHVDAYLALEKLVSLGKARALGVSNYTPEDYQDLIDAVSLPPAVNTFEINPLLLRKDWIDFFQRKGTGVQAYKPLQRGGDVLADEVVSKIAKEVQRSPAQVCIRWALQKQLCVLVKSLQRERMQENMLVFDFDLSREQMHKLDAMTTDEALAAAAAHYEKRRSGTPGPWGDGLRPDKREAVA